MHATKALNGVMFSVRNCVWCVVASGLWCVCVCVSCVMGCNVCKLFELCSQGVGLAELCRLRQDFTYDMYLGRPHLQT